MLSFLCRVQLWSDSSHAFSQINSPTRFAKIEPKIPNFKKDYKQENDDF
jgi:hypothetical protein